MLLAAGNSKIRKTEPLDALSLSHGFHLIKYRLNF